MGERRAVADTVKLLKSEMDRMLTDKAKELDEMIKFIKGLNDNLKGELTIEHDSFTSELKELRKRIELIDKTKVDTEEMKRTMTDFSSVLNMKVDIEEVQNSLNACQADNSGKLIQVKEELMHALKNQNVSLVEQLNKKANAIEVKRHMAAKVDSENMEQLLENYFKSIEIDGLSDKVRDLQNQLEVVGQERSNDGLVLVLKQEVDDLKKALILKANLQDVSAILDQKCNIDDINRSLKIIKSSIQEKCSVKDLDLYTKEQALVNEFLCAENVVGRWRWRSGNLQNKTLVPWEEQTMNTLTDNFIWEKNDTFITVQVSGLYEISFGLFSRKKPSSQLFVNGEPVLSLMNSTSYAVHHSSGKLKDAKGGPNTPSNGLNSSVPTGLTYIEFVMLPARARISISYVCDMPGEGFLGIKRIN